jgi:3-hydroxyisobutyrate dehydrogenase-like beta-hydroxyacid dehydrogenase
VIEREMLMHEAETKNPDALMPSASAGRRVDAPSPSCDGVERPLAQAQVGFIGLGRMGRAMAANLVGAGLGLTAYVRRAQQIEELSALGLRATTQIDDVLGCELIITMLPDDDAVAAVVLGSADDRAAGFVQRMRPGAIHLSMSTISPALAKRLASEQARRGQGYVAAPVFGNPDAAKARQLYVIAAGAATDLDRCEAIFAALGQKVFRVGDDPATANLIKLAGNAMSAVTLEIFGEVLAFARKSGCDPHLLLSIFTGTMFDGRIHKIYGGKIADQQYGMGGFVFPLALKDVRLALEAAERASVPMPTLSVVRDRLITGIARGYSQRDWTALGKLAEEEAGLVS